MGKYFGTDGVRGVANSELTPELAFKLGRVGGYILTKGAQQRSTESVNRSRYTYFRSYARRSTCCWTYYPLE